MEIDIGVVASSRQYFSWVHAAAAHRFCLLSKKTELLDITHIEHNRCFSIYGVIASVCFLESAINEFFEDICSASNSEELRSSIINEPAKKRIAQSWAIRGVEKFSILDKYLLALAALDLVLPDKGKRPFQDTMIVVELRNYLVHYKPESIIFGVTADKLDLLEAQKTVADKMARKLQGKFEKNKLFKDLGNDDFPDKLLGAGCAIWALMSCSEFVVDFYSKVGLVKKAEQISNKYCNDSNYKVDDN